MRPNVEQIKIQLASFRERALRREDSLLVEIVDFLDSMIDEEIPEEEPAPAEPPIALPPPADDPAPPPVPAEPTPPTEV